LRRLTLAILLSVTLLGASAFSASSALRGSSAVRHHVVGDYNGDGRVDIAVYRPSSDRWHIRGVRSVKYGFRVIPVPADYNGDGKTDIAVFNGYLWGFLGRRSISFGHPGDIPLPGDYKGDGKVQLAVFRPRTGWWYIRGVGRFRYGHASENLPDVTAPADYNGDGKVDIAVFSAQHRGPHQQGTWHIRGMKDVNFGDRSDFPVPGDYNGDGRADIATYTPSSGHWHIRGIGNFAFGKPYDTPVPGDYNGDGKTDLAVFRSTTGEWFVRQLFEVRFLEVRFGRDGDIPLAPTTPPTAGELAG